MTYPRISRLLENRPQEFVADAKITARWRELRRWIAEKDSDPEWGAVDLPLVLDKMDELEAIDKEDV